MIKLLWCLLYFVCNIHLICLSHIIKLDCIPEGTNVSENNCMKRRCLWSETIPNCYYPNDYGYFLSGNIEPTANGYTSLIKQRYPSFYDTNDISDVRVNIYEETESRVHIKFIDENNKNSRYEVPIDLPPIPSVKPSKTKYAINFETNNIFGIKIHGSSDNLNSPIINTAIPGFIYSDQFIQISMSIGNYTKIYGFGERFSDLIIPLNTTISLFARDIWNKYPSYSSGYGVHPFGLFINPLLNGDSFGIFFVNSNAMEIVVTDTFSNPTLQFRTIGGILDFYIFLGPKPLDVIHEYYKIVGFPFFPPYWSFGFHLCRWGYLNLNNTKQIVENMRNKMIPYDTQWLDIDYMDNYKIFTYNKNEFKNLPQYIDNILHKQYNMKFIQIIDCGISTSNYDTYNNGIQKDVFIKNKNDTLYIGKVWPGGTVFPDFWNENTIQWWINETKQWYNKIKFDGFWIDMNEPSNFGGDKCNKNKFDEPPYFPKALNVDHDENMDDPFGCGQHSICMNTMQKYKHYSTEHYNIHSLYGYSMIKATYYALLEIHHDQRPFIISRSTFATAGKYGGHWHGDNNASYEHLKQSISGMIMFSMFAVPMNGADVCGFFGNTTIELCIRWIQIGAFYPFSRNHNAITSEFHTIDQDPPALGDIVVSIHRKYLNIRYELLPYLYTLFYKSNVYGLNVINALFMIWFDDINTYDINEQYLWSDNLLFSPAVTMGQDNVYAYFPMINSNNGLIERWYNLESGEEIMRNGWYNIYTPLENTNIHIRGGSIIVLQNNLDGSLTTYDARQKPYKLICALDINNNAKGDLFIDDGNSNLYKNNIFDFIEFEFNSNKVLTNNVKHNQFDNTNLNNGLLNEVVILGMKMENKNIVIYVNDKIYDDFDYDATFNLLKIKNLQLNIDLQFKIECVSSNDIKSEL